MSNTSIYYVYAYLRSKDSKTAKAVEHFFNKVEDAVAFGTKQDPDDHHQHIKVYDHKGQCVHDSHDHHDHDGYA